jgi:hypothetical protein
VPRGVNEKFLRILQHERRARLRATGIVAGLVPVAYFLAELVDEPLYGAVVIACLVAVALGLGAGLGLGAWRTRRYNQSLLDRWNAWQRSAGACTRLDEVARHAEDKGPRAPLAGIGWTALFAANLLLFAALWVETSWATTYGAVVSLLNGALLGVLAGLHLWTARWVRTFRRALDELAAEGQVGYWGEI